MIGPWGAMIVIMAYLQAKADRGYKSAMPGNCRHNQPNYLIIDKYHTKFRTQFASAQVEIFISSS